MKRLGILLIFLLGLGFAQSFLRSVSFEEMDKEKQEILLKVIKHTKVNNFLEQLDNWSADVYVEGLWHIAFYEGEDWVAEVLYDSASEELKADDLPKLLSQEEINVYEEAIKNHIFDDAEVREMFKNPNIYSKELVYHKFENYWSYYLFDGLDEFSIEIYPSGKNYFRIEQITNNNSLNADEQMEVNRNKAIELAYGAEGLDDVFEGFDDWYSYAEKYQDKLWMVEFAAEGKSLATILVDLANEVVLETKLP